MAGWLSSLGGALETVRQQAQKIRDDVGLDEALDAVRQQAHKLTEEAVQVGQAIREAAIVATKDIIDEQDKVKATANPTCLADRVVTVLPWETLHEDRSILSQPLMEKVLGLSLNESTFGPLTEDERRAFPFKIENYVPVAMKLLELDPNLAKMHRRLTPRIPESEFWWSYFYHCVCLRADIGMDDSDEFGALASQRPPPRPQAEPSTSPQPLGTSETPSSPAPPRSKGDAQSPATPARRAASPGRSPQKKQGKKVASPRRGGAETGVVAAGGLAEHKAGPADGTEPPQQSSTGGAAEADDIDLDALEINDVGDDDGLEGDDMDDLEAQIAAELGDEEL